MATDETIHLSSTKKLLNANDTDLSGSTFTNVNLSGTKFKNVNFAGAGFEDAKPLRVERAQCEPGRREDQ